MFPTSFLRSVFTSYWRWKWFKLTCCSGNAKASQMFLPVLEPLRCFRWRCFSRPIFSGVQISFEYKNCCFGSMKISSSKNSKAGGLNDWFKKNFPMRSSHLREFLGDYFLLTFGWRMLWMRRLIWETAAKRLLAKYLANQIRKEIYWFSSRLQKNLLKIMTSGQDDNIYQQLFSSKIHYNAERRQWFQLHRPFTNIEVHSISRHLPTTVSDFNFEWIFDTLLIRFWVTRSS